MIIGSTIKNLILQNVVINNGIYNGVLVGKANNINIDNIKIIGNMVLKGKFCSCFISYLSGNLKNIQICVDGEILSHNKALVSNNLELGGFNKFNK